MSFFWALFTAGGSTPPRGRRAAYHRRVTLARTFGACLTAVLVLNLCLTPLWLHIMYGNAFVLSAGRLLKNIVKLPVDTGLLYALLRLAETRLVPQLRRR